jgi:phosphoribosylanthranilate isomerase
MWVKICGFKDLELAEIAVEAGVDAIGLNFYAKSSRFITPASAEIISKTLNNRVLTVGLFVNHSADDVSEIITQCELPAVQFHGDETPEYLSEIQIRFPDLKIIKAYRMKGNDLSPLKEYLDRCKQLNFELFACLVDAFSDKQYGGTGNTVHWPALDEEYSTEEWPPLILAGGLNPDNISEAIEQAKPWGIDVASGVESAPGIKNADLIKDLMNQLQ